MIFRLIFLSEKSVEKSHGTSFEIKIFKGRHFTELRIVEEANVYKIMKFWRQYFCEDLIGENFQTNGKRKN